MGQAFMKRDFQRLRTALEENPWFAATRHSYSLAYALLDLHYRSPGLRDDVNAVMRLLVSQGFDFSRRFDRANFVEKLDEKDYTPIERLDDFGFFEIKNSSNEYIYANRSGLRENISFLSWVFLYHLYFEDTDFSFLKSLAAMGVDFGATDFYIYVLGTVDAYKIDHIGDLPELWGIAGDVTRGEIPEHWGGRYTSELLLYASKVGFEQVVREFIDKGLPLREELPKDATRPQADFDAMGMAVINGRANIVRLLKDQPCFAKGSYVAVTEDELKKLKPYYANPYNYAALLDDQEIQGLLGIQPGPMEIEVRQAIDFQKAVADKYSDERLFMAGQPIRFNRFIAKSETTELVRPYPSSDKLEKQRVVTTRFIGNCYVDFKLVNVLEPGRYYLYNYDFTVSARGSTAYWNRGWIQSHVKDDTYSPIIFVRK